MKVERKDKESLNSLINRFNKKIEKYNIFSDFRENMFYESPSDIRHKKKQRKKREKRIKDKKNKKKELEIKLRKRK